jgi:hypothetical protein
MSYLKLRELWSECEKLDLLEMGVFIGGLTEIANAATDRARERISSQSQKPCVAQEKRAVCNRGRWEPQEDDLLHKCVSSSFNPHQGFIAFASDPSNKKRRSKEAAQQRYYAMVTEGKW